jgi:hypothetical protein
VEKYISKPHLKDFENSLPQIKKIIGVKSTNDMPKNFGIAGNTFRAYRNWKNRPSHNYQVWAKSVTDDILKSDKFPEIEEKEDFDVWHTSLAASLQKQWCQIEGKPLSFAHTYKLVDLYIKFLSGFRFKNNTFLEGLIKNANCALDSQIIKRINVCYDNMLPVSKPSMGDIHGRSTYDFCQNLIELFANCCGATRLEFDYWAWVKGNG